MFEGIENYSIPVIYITGSGHSGSTLLDLILGTHSQIESAGEIHKYYDYVANDSPRKESKKVCTCGNHVNKCMYWLEVKDAVKNELGGTEISLEEENIGEFAKNNEAVIKSILQTSKKRIFCDSSKNIDRLRKYLSSPVFKVTIVHLVRDGRAVAYSNKKKNRSYYKHLNNWRKSNLNLINECKNYENYIQVKYEDLVNNPKVEVEKVLKIVNCSFEANQLLFGNFKHHNLSGNRMRMSKSKISFDDSYIRELTFYEWYIGTMVALPAIKYFGYSYSRNSSKFKII